MSGGFLDSNVLLYAFSLEDERRFRARALLMDGGTISVQCLNEFVSVARRKLGMTWMRATAARDEIVELSQPVVPLTLDLHRHGIELAERYQLSGYDGLIVAAALTADCTTLYSEDMHDGLLVAKRLTIRNPFA